MKYRLVIADVDGTLIKPGDCKTTGVSPRVAKSVETARKKGAVFSIATARSMDWVETLVKAMKLDSLIILDNGARIYDCMTEKYIFNAYISKKKVEEIMSVLKKLPFEKYYVDTNNRYLYNPLNPQIFKEVVKIMILHVSPYDAQEIFETVSSIKDIRVTKSVSGTDPVKESIHITDIEASKEKALKRIIDLLGISQDQVIAIGDSYNDFSLLTSSGLKVAMGNAVAEIKSIADYIAPSYDQDGVADVLDKFIIKES